VDSVIDDKEIGMSYKVKVADNYDYMDSSYTAGIYSTLEAAVEACKRIVDQCLNNAYKPGMSAAALNQSYQMFGDDPYILGGRNVPFSAWKYAEQRCQQICGNETEPD